MAAAVDKFPNTRSVLIIGVASVVLPLVICIWKPIYWPGRYLIIALPPIAALLGTMLGLGLSRRIMAAVAVLLLVMDVSGQWLHRDENPETPLPLGQSDRTTAHFLLQNAVAGDAIVFTSTTRAAADYYFRRAGAQRFVEIDFPREVDQHLGWTDPELTPARRAALEPEAESSAQQLEAVAAAGRHVWLYHGFATPLSDLLKKKLDDRLSVRHVHALVGPYHLRVIEYGALYNRQSTEFRANVSALPGISTASLERHATIPSGRTNTAPQGVIP
jgi:uncharacterized membrane protein